MPSISENLARLSAFRSRGGAAVAAPDRLNDFANFGSNPGALGARVYLPVGLETGAPLVVVLHGCTQNAAGYDAGSGWSQLADRYGFALLFPEQTRANNPNLCFNWFEPGDIARNSGEALSIRQMIGALVAKHALDDRRIFATGLSAGGAMTAVMLATYPELFAGGAILAGLPYGTAIGVSQALERMRGQGGPSEKDLSGLVRAASDHKGPWPAISIWHGTADHTVSRSNAEAIVAQWRPLHGLNRAPTRQDRVDGYPHRVWCDASGRALIEQYEITGLAHGTPLATQGADAVGMVMPHMLEAGISSTWHIASAWGIADAAPAQNPLVPAGTAVGRSLPPVPPNAAAAPAGQDVGQIIEDALRFAGLMR